MAVIATLGNLSLRQLEVFYAVVAAGSVTGAAESLKVSQPTVSTMLKRIEDQLGLALFRKNRGRLVPTNEGRVLFETLQRNFKYLQAISDAISVLQKGVAQRMSIATIQPLGNGIISKALQMFLNEQKDARVQLLIRPRKAVYHAVSAEGADLGISFRTGEAEREGLQVETISSGRLFCIMPKGHALEAKEKVGHTDLSEHPFVSYPPGHQWLQLEFEKSFEEGNERPEPVLTVESVMAVYPHVENGIGIGLVDEYSLRYYSKEHISFRPYTPKINVDVELIYPNRRPSDLTKTFVRHLKAICS